MLTAATLARLSEVAAGHPGLALLALHGSQARGDARADSDWDFAWLAQTAERVDVEGLTADLVIALGSERIDLADLARAGGLLRFQVARDGVPIIERPPGAFERFAIEAVTFWCDVEPVLREAYEAVLADLTGPRP
ncbi:MAG: nucleotidyltransferase domain-containing protein [Myxococcales bacterium]|nr:nucleotidyltransferase domain-containing protein [Myxococcales bacterium]